MHSDRTAVEDDRCAVCSGAPESTRHMGIDPRGHRYEAPAASAPDGGFAGLPYAQQPRTAGTGVAADGPRNPLLAQTESHPPPSILQMSADLAYRAEGDRLCGLGYHAWMPWLPIWVGDPAHISRYETYCVRCRHPEQFDV